LRLDAETPNWGYRRIHGEMRRLGYRIAASTVWKILRDGGRMPTPNRTGPSWSELIASQAHALVATAGRLSPSHPAPPGPTRSLSGGSAPSATNYSTDV